MSEAFVWNNGIVKPWLLSSQYMRFPGEQCNINNICNLSPVERDESSRNTSSERTPLLPRALSALTGAFAAVGIISASLLVVGGPSKALLKSFA